MINLGNIVVSPNVIKDIIVETLKEVNDVCSIYGQDEKNTFTSFFKTQEGKKKPIEVEMGETECVIDISIVVVYGSKIQSVAQEVQKVIKEKVEAYTSINVKEVNVNIEKVQKLEEVNVVGVDENV